MNGASAAVGGVVLYSFALPHFYGVLPNGLTVEHAATLKRCAELDCERSRVLAHAVLQDRLVADVIAHRRTLAEATDVLLASEADLPPSRLEHLHWLYEGHSDRECLAATFVGFAVASCYRNPSFARRVWHELGQAYRRASARRSPGAVSDRRRCGR